MLEGCRADTRTGLKPRAIPAWSVVKKVASDRTCTVPSSATSWLWDPEQVT